jgi:hypothetical protein
VRGRRKKNVPAAHNFQNDRGQLLEFVRPRHVERVGINSPTIRTVVNLAGVRDIPPLKIVARMEQFLARAKD